MNGNMLNGKNQLIEVPLNQDYEVTTNANPFDRLSGPQTQSAHGNNMQTNASSGCPQSIMGGFSGMGGTGPFSIMSAARLQSDILEFSPFNFYHGINAKRLLKGRSQLQKNHLQMNLICGFC